MFDIPVFDVSCSVADLDVWKSGSKEVLTAEVFDSTDTLLESITITAGDTGTGDQIATLVEFSTGNVSRLALLAANSQGHAGWGVDNLSFTPVPGAAILGMIGLSVAGYRLRRRKTA